MHGKYTVWKMTCKTDVAQLDRLIGSDLMEPTVISVVQKETQRDAHFFSGCPGIFFWPQSP